MATATGVDVPYFGERSRPATGSAVDGLRERWIAMLEGRAIRVAFAEGEDPRVVVAAAALRDTPLTPVLLGRPEVVRGVARDAEVNLGDLEPVDPAELADRPAYRDALEDALGGRSPTPGYFADPLALATAAVRLGDVDGCVAGCQRPTADVLRAAFRVIGLAPGARTVSSCFLMIMPDGRRLCFGDCAVVPEPDSEQLADIARATSTTFRALTGESPAVAMLSFSTKGSARHPRVERVRSATARLLTDDPALVVDGELQFDAAVLESVARSKVGDSPVAGRANVLIFPNLDAGNIGYKIAERLGGATALGPILQGLAGPVNDLSRGCSARDIYTVGLITAAEAVGTRRTTGPG